MKILLIGSGYVGSHLGSFLQRNHDITITTRSSDRLVELKTKFKNVELLDTSDMTKLSSLVKSHDVIVVTVAAKNINEYEKAYLQTALNLKKVIKGSECGVKHIIYTSASSVYGDQKGKVTTESAPLSAKTVSGKILINTEKALLDLQKEALKICIFRLSEIYGPAREISLRVKRLSELSAPGTGQNPTNMIHLDDIIAAISFALKNELNDIYNLTDDEHIARKDMYELISKKFNLPSVIFDESKTSIHGGSKVLSNEKLKNAGYIFLHPKRAYI